MKRRVGRKPYFSFLLVLLLCIGIGYAFLTQDLTINGTSKVKGNTWDIHFDNLVPNSGNVTLSSGDVAAAINTTNPTSVTYTITLKEPGQFYEFTVDVVNAGTLDAMVGSVTNKMNGTVISTTNPLPNYLSYTVTYSDGVEIALNHLLEVGNLETYKVRLEYKRDVEASDLPDMLQTITLTFEVNYVQADENSIVKPNPPASWTFPVGRNSSNLQVGDEVCLVGTTTECFNFIRYDGSNAVLLAKYNLKVGQITSGGNRIDYYKETDEGYGLQSSDMRGATGGTTNYGVVSFAYTYYWEDPSTYTLKTKYGTSYPADVYDSDYNTAPNPEVVCEGYDFFGCTEGYSIAYYVEMYKNTITGRGYWANIQEARLLTMSEATNNLGCTTTCPTGTFLTYTTFWLGTTTDGTWFKNIDYNGYFGSVSCAWDHHYYNGVRPVIVISMNDIGDDI